MSALRILACSYLVSASVFVVAAGLVSHPELGRDLSRAGAAAAARLHALFDAPSPVVRLTLAPEQPADARTWARSTSIPIAPRDVAPNDDRLAEPEFSASVTLMILPDLTPEMPARVAPPAPRLARPRLPRAAMPEFDIATAPSVAPSISGAIPAPPPLPGESPRENLTRENLTRENLARGILPQGTGRAAAAANRLAAGLTPEMLRHFELFLYVSKAARGPLAQRMYVFDKQGGELRLLHDWAASTGREQSEVNARGRASFTATPPGYYQLDPKRMYRRYQSWSWDQPMPHAMFFNWERRGLQTGLAIHAASGDWENKLGSRASAGCVQLSPENARTLYELVRGQYRGQAPRFAYNGKTRTMSNQGAFQRDAKGRLAMADGYKVLIFIEDYGGSDRVAALY